MGSRASSLLREEDIEEIKKETGCKLLKLRITLTYIVVSAESLSAGRS